MKIGITIPRFVTPVGDAGIGSQFAAMARDADQAGLDSLWVMDHFFQIEHIGPAEEPMLEGYATLAFAAGITQRITLGTLVTGVTYRHPGILVKTVSTLDVLSGGRAWLGIGSGHYEQETRGLGIPFPPQKERFEMLEETIQIALRMWSGERGDERPFEGKHHRLERPLNLPQSLSRPHPPIMIAGDGERKTLRLVARYADACSLRPGSEVPKKLDVLRRHCEAEGRDYEEIEKTCAFAFDVGEDGEKVGELIGQLSWLAGMSIETVVGVVPNVDQIRPLEIIGREVIPAVADL
jgi:F420-dependent oxidoreductase-like protein